MKTHSIVETLEARIAPAAVFTLTDVDGDAVTVKTSKGTNAQLVSVFTTQAVGMGVAIREIDFSPLWTVFDGTDLSVVVTKKSATGDGLVNVRYIDATGGMDGASLNLGHVVIDGDVETMDAGRNDGLAVESLKTASWGVAEGANYQSNFSGELGTVTISGLMTGAQFVFSDAQAISVGAMQSAGFFASGDVGKVKVVGKMEVAALTAASFGAIKLKSMDSTSLVSAAGSVGELNVAGPISGLAKIEAGGIGKLICRGGFAGEATVGSLDRALVVGDLTGRINANTLGKLVVTGKMTGDVTGKKAETGYVSVTGNVGSIRIAGDVLSTLGEETGFIEVGGSVGSIRIGGSLRGFPALNSEIDVMEVDDIGCIQIGGDLGRLLIGGDLAGTSILSAGYQSDTTGAVIVQGNLGTAVIGGSIFAGAENQTGLQSSGTIQVGKNLGSLLVKGDVIGQANNLAVISALGADGSPDALAIGKVVVLGDVKDATIRAGDSASEILNQNESRDESIGLVKVGGDFVRSTVFAGQSGSFDSPAITARIARIVIGGSATGGTPGQLPAYGFLAQEVGALRVGGKNYTLTPGALNDVKIELDPNGNTILAEKML